MLTQKTSGPSVLQTGRVLFLPLGAIRPNPAQPRSVFDAAGLQELAASIRQYGVLQPLSVRKKGSGFELVAGERRLRAAGLAGCRVCWYRRTTRTRGFWRWWRICSGGTSTTSNRRRGWRG